MNEQQRAESEYLRDEKKIGAEILKLYPDEDQRKRIFAEYIQAQRTAEAETLIKYPAAAQAKESKELLSKYSTDLERAQHMGELPSVQYGTENRIKHYKQVAEKNRLTFPQLFGIVFEANAKMWPMPKK
jgi:hypothetical protein